MEVEYEITRDDLFAFQWRAAFTSAAARRRRRKVYGIWFLALLLFAIVPAIGPDGFVLSRVSFTFLLIAFPVVAALQWYLERRLMRSAILQLVRQEKPERGQLGRHRVALSDSGVLEQTDVSESRTAWAGVDRVEQDLHYIFIYISHGAAHVVPKRAFRDSHEAEAFYQRLRAGTEPGR
jgi:hypothetical protein